MHFGDDPADALERAAARVRKALAYTRGLGAHPHRGTGLAIGNLELRCVTSEDFVFYFEIDDLAAEVTILAVSFGGADHRSQIPERLRPS